MPDRSPADPDPLLDRPAGLPAWVPSVDDERTLAPLRWFIGLVFFLGIGACVVEGADRPADPVLGDGAAAPSSSPSSSSAPAGDGSSGATAAELADRLGLVQVALREAGGAITELCLLLADAADERAQGLMGVTDFGDVDGMVFRFDADTSGQFFMFQTPTPLDIGFWRADGSFVSATRMAPCLDQPSGDCERYPAGGPYRTAVEVPAGGFDDVDLATTTLEVGGSCTPA